MNKENVIDFFKECRKDYLKLGNNGIKNCGDCPVKEQCDTMKERGADVALCVAMTPKYVHVEDIWTADNTNNILVYKTSLECWGNHFIYKFMPCQIVYYAVYTEDDKCIHIESCTLDLTKTSYNDALNKCKKYCEDIINQYKTYMSFLGFVHCKGVANVFGEGGMPTKPAEIYKEILETEGFEVKNIMPFGWRPQGCYDGPKIINI